MFRALTPARATARARASPPTRGTAVDAIAPARANNRYSVALLLTGVRVPWQAPQSTRKRVLLFCFGLSPLRIQSVCARASPPTRGTAVDAIAPARANNRYSVALLLTGVRVPWQAPQSTRKRVLLFLFRALTPAHTISMRAGKPADTRNRSGRDCAVGRTIAIPSRCSLRGLGFESRGRRQKAPENGCFCFVSGSHPCACNGTRAGKPADMRNRSGRDCAVGRTIAIPSRCSLRGFEQSCRRQRQNNEPKGKRLRHFTFKIISGACACAGGDGAGEGGGGTGHTPY